jgi:hypothetical protein
MTQDNTSSSDDKALRFNPNAESYGSTDEDIRQNDIDYGETAPLSQSNSNDSMSVRSIDTYGGEEEVDSVLSSLYEEDPDSFHLGTSRVSAANVFTSIRRTPSFELHGEQYQLVPTQLKQNVKLVTDVNLHERERGRLYFARSSFYHNTNEPKYALTVQPGIYREIVMEINDAFSTPCGLFFCCHGGDGAHSGVSHDDYVDIRLAWLITALIFVSILVIHATLLQPEGVNGFDDDIIS